MTLSYENIDPDFVDKMEKIQNWAEAQLKEEGTPWAGFHYMRLIDAIEAIMEDRHYVLNDEASESEASSPSGSSGVVEGKFGDS